MAHWYYEADGSQQGPVEEPTLRDLIDGGVIARDTLVWTDGMNGWAPASEVSGLFGGPPPLQSTPPAPPRTARTREPGSYVENHMVKAVLVTLVCCLPLGIVAIVNASQVNGAVAQGDYAEAERLAAKADGWANWSIGLGLVVGVLYFLVGVGGGF